MEYPSKLLEKAVDQMSQLPGVGKRTALRLMLHLLRQPEHQTFELAKALHQLRENINYCPKCYTICDEGLCDICRNPSRDRSIICVVEDVRDVMAIENTQQFRGLYHVLGGKISPMDGIGPHQLHIKPLVERIREGNVQEIIFALSSTMEGDTTNYYIYKQIKDFNVKTSTIARGIAVGDEIEFADEITLGRSLIHRIPFENSIGG